MNQLIITDVNLCFLLQVYDKYLRAKALSIVYSCISLLGAVSGVFKVISLVLLLITVIGSATFSAWKNKLINCASFQSQASGIVKSILNPWINEFIAILNEPMPSEDPDDWSVRMEVKISSEQVL